MKNIVSFCPVYRCFVLSICLLLLSSLLRASDARGDIGLKFKQISTFNGLPTDEVQKIYQDKEGFIWFATRYGLCKYDGYQATVYKSNLYVPGMLTNNNIYCLADDYDDNLWIGTQGGLNVPNKRTGEIRQYRTPSIPDNLVSCLLVTKDNTVWVGTDGGLCRYMADKDSLLVYDDRISEGVFKKTVAKSLFEDSDGDVWIGTWSDGLYRYSPKPGKFFEYPPPINERNSAHVIY